MRSDGRLVRERLWMNLFLRRDVATPYGFGEIRRFVAGLGMSPSRIVGFARHFTPQSANSFPRTNIAASVSGFCL